MRLSRKQRCQLHKNLQTHAETNPSAFRTRVFLLCMLGYVYIGFMLFLLFALVAGLVHFVFSAWLAFLVLKIGLIVSFAIIMIRAFWANLDPYEGIELSPDKYPQLFEIIHELCRKSKTAIPHKVFIDYEFGARVYQTVIIELVGFSHNHLVIGLPLMHVLSPEQLKAVISHEIGHLAGNRTRFYSWINRTKNRYSDFCDTFVSRDKWYSHLTRPFFKHFSGWYSPLLDAYSSVLFKTHEYHADHMANLLAGEKNSLGALTTTDVFEWQLNEKYWKEVEKRKIVLEQAPEDIISNMIKCLEIDPEPEFIKNALTKTFSYKPWTDSAHPAFADRFERLGVAVEGKDLYQFWSLFSSDDRKIRSSEYYLGEDLEELISSLDSSWKEDNEEEWNKQYTELQERKQVLEELEKERQQRELTVDESYQYARFTSILKGDDEALLLLKALHEEYPSHTSINLEIGRIYLKKLDNRGLEYLKRVQETDHFGAVYSMCLIEDYLRNTGCEEDHELLIENDKLAGLFFETS